MNQRQTEKLRNLLPAEYRSMAPLAQVMEKASIFWALCLSPFVWALLNKHYVIGFDNGTRKLYLFHVPMGLFGLGHARTVESYTTVQLEDAFLREHLLTATLTFVKPDGTEIKLFAPNTSKKNTKAIYAALQA